MGPIQSIFQVSLAIYYLPVSFAFHLPASNASCRCMPGDVCWPSTQDWAQLNQTVGGRLIATVPLASPCHDPNYDEAQCNYLKEFWTTPILHETSPISLMSPWFQSATCHPFTARHRPCRLGNSPVYAINVTSADDAAAGIRFAQRNNIRLVVKNTGHDFNGKSTGRGSLGLWTHNLNSLEVIPHYSRSYYTGPAVKLGAGVRGAKAVPVAQAHGLRVVSGSCPTVGSAGGFTQGGGHSPLSSVYGMGADQALEWEVVTANGSHIIATPEEFSDLYWALSGGGPGTYGVVISLTVRAYQDGIVGGAAIAVSSAGISNDTFWDGYASWQAMVPALVDAGGSAAWVLSSDSLVVMPVTLPDADANGVRKLLAPFLNTLAQLNISYSMNVTTFPTFLDHYTLYHGPLPEGRYPIDRLIGGRLVPRDTVDNNNAGLVAAMRDIIENTSGTLWAVTLSTNASHAIAPNSVLPQWRDAVIWIQAATQWDFTAPMAANVGRANELNDVIIPKLAAVTPGAGAYMNEGNVGNPTWKEDYYGRNYERLLEVKDNWDPQHLFYGPTIVGSDVWTLANDGRLCRA